MTPRRPPIGRLLLGAVLAAGTMAAIAGLSRLPVPMHQDDEAMLRLSWRLSGLTRATCVPIPPEEQAALPAHMRREEVCEERFPEYRLQIRVDGTILEERVVRGGGARGDRPLVVYQELPMPPGVHRLDVRFEPLEDDAAEALPRLRYEGEVSMNPRSVALLTLHPDSRTLVARVGTGRAPTP
jgi:hypothetical protein